ncbi:MAG: helix-turn-helix transcriptional regulator, partial [Clostridia bacterium]|nr:helix-turn-helix transcriptional regulator [Clostridia bacterium]
MLSFGQRLKLLRNEADISQSDLADALGVSAQSVSKWECDAYCPDLSLLLPISGVLGVTTDCLLGAGMSEKDDRETLIKEIKAIQNGQCGGTAHERRSYRIAGLIEEFLKKYPLNYEMKIKYADWIHLYLYSGKVRGSYEIPDEEFEELWSKGFRTLVSVKNHDNDPTRLAQSRFEMIFYYDLKGEYEKAEALAAELPLYPITRIYALYEIARESRNYEKAEMLSVAAAVESYNECSWLMWQRARRISIFGQVRKEEAIAAWSDALRCALEYDRAFGKSWPYSELKGIIEDKNHPKIIASNIYFGLIGDL